MTGEDKSALYKIKYIKDIGHNENGNSQQTDRKAGTGIEMERVMCVFAVLLVEGMKRASFPLLVMNVFGKQNQLCHKVEIGRYWASTRLDVSKE